MQEDNDLLIIVEKYILNLKTCLFCTSIKTKIYLYYKKNNIL